MTFPNAKHPPRPGAGQVLLTKAAAGEQLWRPWSLSRFHVSSSRPPNTLHGCVTLKSGHQLFVDLFKPLPEPLNFLFSLVVLPAQHGKGRIPLHETVYGCLVFGEPIQ